MEKRQWDCDAHSATQGERSFSHASEWNPEFCSITDWSRTGQLNAFYQTGKLPVWRSSDSVLIQWSKVGFPFSRKRVLRNGILRLSLSCFACIFSVWIVGLFVAWGGKVLHQWLYIWHKRIWTWNQFASAEERESAIFSMWNFLHEKQTSKPGLIEREIRLFPDVCAMTRTNCQKQNRSVVLAAEPVSHQSFICRRPYLKIYRLRVRCASNHADS